MAAEQNKHLHEQIQAHISNLNKEMEKFNTYQYGVYF